MTPRLTHWLAMATAAVAMACTTTQTPVTTTTRTSTTTATTTSTAGGDVMLSDATGMWIDSAGGTWIDTSGVTYMGGRRGMVIGLQPVDIGSMTNANIVAHLAAGDSIEVALSQLGVDKAQSSAVRDFARRMVTEHSAHMQTARQTASEGGITPMASAADTADATMAGRMANRLSTSTTGAMWDRQFMRAEVGMHQHMLHELEMVRPKSSGAAQQLVDQTIPVVRQHLADARSVWRQVGGGMNDHRMGTNP